MNSALPDLVARVRDYTNLPLAVGFGVATRAHFDLVADAGADGVVIGRNVGWRKGRCYLLYLDIR